jgi:hypothetical protein
MRQLSRHPLGATVNETKYELEYLQLLDLCFRLVESIKGQEVTEDTVWLTETQPTATKLFYHLGSIYYLSKGTTLPDLAGVKIGYIDFPSIVVVARAAFETYLTFYFIFVAPSSIEEKQFRYKIWDLGGLLDRQKFPVTLEENKAKLSEEKLIIDKLISELISNPFYLSLKSDQKKEARKGNWRLDKHWTDLAHIAGFDQAYFKNIYRYLCSYAHSGNLSILQLSQVNDKQTQLSMAETWLGLGLVLMGHFSSSYVSIYPKSKTVLQSFPDAARTADIWDSVGRKLK